MHIVSTRRTCWCYGSLGCVLNEKGPERGKVTEGVCTLSVGGRPDKGMRIMERGLCTLSVKVKDLREVWESRRGCVYVIRRSWREHVCHWWGEDLAEAWEMYALDQWEVTDGCVCLK